MRLDALAFLPVILAQRAPALPLRRFGSCLLGLCTPRGKPSLPPAACTTFYSLSRPLSPWAMVLTPLGSRKLLSVGCCVLTAASGIAGSSHLGGVEIRVHHAGTPRLHVCGSGGARPRLLHLLLLLLGR